MAVSGARIIGSVMWLLSLERTVSETLGHPDGWIESLTRGSAEMQRTDIVKKIALLGSTGSIGAQTLDVCRRFPDRFRIVALAAGRNAELLAAQANDFHPDITVPADAQLPVDSEHSAIFQCLAGNRLGDVARIIVTASGGPFRRSSRQQMQAATLYDALRHPTWKMGAKITIDSATMMNKGLEAIEAHHLF